MTELSRSSLTAQAATDWTGSPRRDAVRMAVSVLAMAYLTWLIVAGGLAFGSEYLTRRPHPHQNVVGWFPAFGAWDGVWYQRITALGYEYDPHKQSSVAYFPLLPLLAGGIRWATGLDALTSLLVVSLSAHIIGVVVFAQYVRQYGDVASAEAATITFLLWPMSLFLRMAYTESLFVLWLILACYGIRRQWPLVVIALLAGAATGTRSTGVALLLPLAWEIWKRFDTWPRTLVRFAYLMPLALWGLLAYMVFQHAMFGDALAFVKTQNHWSARPDQSPVERLVATATLEPIWSPYVPGSAAYWSNFELARNPLFSLQFWNAAYFVACAAIVAIGYRKRLITTHELLLTVGLLGIPYVLQGYRMMMMGHGRFTCVVFPMFIVLGRWMSAWPAQLTAILWALMAVQLFYWSALFASWNYVF